MCLLWIVSGAMARDMRFRSMMYRCTFKVLFVFERPITGFATLADTDSRRS